MKLCEEIGVSQTNSRESRSTILVTALSLGGGPTFWNDGRNTYTQICILLCSLGHIRVSSVYRMNKGIQAD